MRDVIIVGGGPAGLSAALVLGRCRRSVLVLDEGKPRNARSSGVHGYLGLDGIAPAALREAARRDLARYDVELRDTRVVSVERAEEGFVTVDATGAHEHTRKLLIATGVEDRLPPIEGADTFYGRGVYPCMYCDGWEVRDRRLGAFAEGEGAAAFALGLLAWSRHVTLYTNGGEAPPPAERSRLARNGVHVEERAVAAFGGDDDRLAWIALADGERVPCDALFLRLGLEQRSTLAASLGCEIEEKGMVRTFDKQRTCVDGVYLAGDASHDVKLAIVAAAHGARAAEAINTALREEDTA